jgi:chromosome segregation ATPase
MWKSIILSSLFLFTFLFTAFAQQATRVVEKELSIEDYEGRGYQVVLYRTDEDDIKKQWKKHMKRRNGEVDIKGDIIKSENVHLDGVEGELTIIAEVDKENDQARTLSVLFLQGSTVVNSISNVAADVVFEKEIYTFANDLSKEAAENLLKEEEKTLEQLKDDLKDAEKNEERARDAIRDCEETIKEKRKEIDELTKKQKDLKKSIDNQQEKTKSAESEYRLFN